MVSNTDNKMYVLGVVVVLVGIAIYIYTKKYEHLKSKITDCTTCTACKKGFKRPSKTSRYGCNSTNCKCIEDIQAVDTSYYKLRCDTCPKCGEGMERPPGKVINTSRSKGCDDRRCRCQSLD